MNTNVNILKKKWITSDYDSRLALLRPLHIARPLSLIFNNLAWCPLKYGMIIELT